MIYARDRGPFWVKRQGVARETRLARGALLFPILLKHGVTVECLKTMAGLKPTIIKATTTRMIFLGRGVASILIRFPNPVEIMRPQDVQDFPDCKFVVDASHVRIERPRDQRAQREFYSGRHKFHEVRLQTLNTSSGEAVHVAVAKGPCAAGSLLAGQAGPC